jgi:Zn-dependent protease with chaperone function
VGALILGIIFLFTKRANSMFLSQGVTAFAVIEGFRQMACPMTGLVWLYLGIISGAIVLMGVVQKSLDSYVQNLEIKDANLMSVLSKELGCDVYLLDTQKKKAFTHRRRIFLSVGLIELLEPDEIRSVAAHELYHVRHTPNRMVANTLAVASMWLKSYRDDAQADRFAAELYGKEELKSALEKLGVKNREKRMKRLDALTLT